MNKTPKMLEIEGRLKESIESFLEREYLDYKKSSIQIATKLGVINSTICDWLRQIGVSVRTTSEAMLPNGVIRPNKTKLAKLYLQERKSTDKIAQEIGVGEATIRRWLRNSNIKIRDASESKLSQNIIKPKKEELNQLYLQERKNTREIAELLGVSSRTILNWLKKYGVKIRSNSEAHLPEDVTKPSKKQLENLYVKNRKDIAEISEELNVSVFPISKWLKQYGIPIRNQSGIYNNKILRKEIVERVLRNRNKSLEKLSTTDFLRTRKEDGKTCIGVIAWYERKHKCKAGEARDKLVEDLYGIRIKRNNLIITKEEFIDLLKKDEAARKLAIASVSLNGSSNDVEQIITEIYEGRFKDQSQLHKLLSENSGEVYALMYEGVTSLGNYLGGFKLGDRNIIPVLVGEVISSIPESKITTSLEEKLVRILRVSYSPRFNEKPSETIIELKEKIKQTKGKKKRLYQELHKHYEEVMGLGRELN